MCVCVWGRGGGGGGGGDAVQALEMNLEILDKENVRPHTKGGKKKEEEDLVASVSNSLFLMKQI